MPEWRVKLWQTKSKIGAYICKGCGLGERLDCGELATIAQREGKASLVREHDFLCNAEGVAMIRNDIDSEGVNRVVIAACSRRAKTEAFNFENVAIARANLREGVIWARPDTDEAARDHAGDGRRLRAHGLRRDQVHERRRHVNAGERPATTPAGGRRRHRRHDRGAGSRRRPATRSPSSRRAGSLGGAAAKLYKRIPESHALHRSGRHRRRRAWSRQSRRDSKITVHLNSTITKTSGAPGRFSADITTESGAHDHRKLRRHHHGLGRDAIMTPASCRSSATARARTWSTRSAWKHWPLAANGGPIKRPSDGKEVKNVVFVQCAGQRSNKEGHLPYCSGHCCLTSIKQAMYFKDQNPQIDTNIIYSDLRTPGAGGEDFYRSGQQKGITFTKGAVSEVTVNGGNGCR